MIAKEIDELIRRTPPLSVWVVDRFVLPRLDPWQIDAIGLDDIRAVARIGLWNAARGYDPAKGRFATYATHAIRRTVRMFLDRQFRSLWWRGTGDLDADTSPLDEIPSRRTASIDDLELARLALRLLPPRFARIVRQRYFQQRTLDDIADREGIRKERVRQIIRRALQTCRERLACV